MTSQHRRGWLLAAALAYLAFVVYGSLVPLDFQPLPLNEALDAFRNIRYLRLGIASRADWVANILLFVPLAYLWLGALWSARSGAARLFASVFVLAGCAALSLAIEFTQLFFPARTVSLNDIIAEASGAVIGVAAWWLTGSRFTAWLSGWSFSMSATGTAQRFLYAYLFVLFGYNVLPLDLTISPVEVFHKWREGKIILIPFSAPFPSVAQQAYDLLTDVAIWIPAAFLWRAGGRRTTGTVVTLVVTSAVVLELLQLFVYSRITDLTDIVTAGIGGVIGGLLGSIAVRSRHPDHGSTSDRRSWRAPWLWTAGLLLILGVLAVVFWYPFDFRTDWSFVQGRVAALPSAPLTAYYYGTEFRAVTEVLHKVGFFLPLGAWLAVGMQAVRRRYPVPEPLLHGAALLIVAATAAGIELIQLFLPTKNVDPTDWVLETFGGIAGYAGVRMLARIWQPHAADSGNG